MSQLPATFVRRSGPVTAAATLLLYAAAAIGQAQSTPPADSVPPGRIDFARANLPPANVELDLSQGMFADLFGISDAAVAGVAESLLKSAEANRGAEGTRMAAEKLAAAREILQLAREVVREVRVRAYDNRPNEAAASYDQLMAQFEGQLQEAKWETVARVRQGKQNARLALLRDNGSIRGVFVIATEGSDVMVANVVADVSPANVKKLTSAAATVGLENGLQQAIEQQMRQFQRQSMPRGTAIVPAPTAAPPRAETPAVKVEPGR